MSADAPEEQLDLTEFCTNEQHAIDRAKWLCQQRHYVTHSVKFKTVPTEAPIQAGSVIKVGLETLRYDTPVSGAVGSDGTLICTEPLSGAVDCLTWDGTTMRDETVEFGKNKAIGKTSFVFMVKNSVIESVGYKVQSIGFDEEGNLDIEAIYWPLESDGTSSLVQGFADSNFTIER